MSMSAAPFIKLHCLLFFAVASQLAAADTRIADLPPFSAAPKDLIAEANAVSNKGTDAVVLFDEERWVYQKDGQVRHVTRVIFQVLTAQGVEDWSSIEQRWEPWHEKRPVIRARVISPEGAAHELDQGTLVDASAAAQDNNVYSDVRTVRGPLPAVTPGSIVEEQIEENGTPLLHGDATRVFFGRSVPVRLSRLTIEYPYSLPLRYSTHLLPDVKTAKSSDAGTTRLTLEIGSLGALEPVAPLLPPDVPRWPQVTFSTAGSWNDLAKEYSGIVEARIADAGVAPIVERALAGTKERPQIISRLVRELHNQVRYTGVEFGDAAIIPAKPLETLKRKYGDCKDKAALLVAMLRQAGIPAHLALLAAGPGQDVDEKHPGFGLFDHAIVYVPGSPDLGSADLWIDATADYLAPGFLPAADQGRLALVVRSETTGLTAIPESPSSANRVIQTREFFMPDYGSARVVETSEATGNSDAWYRANYGSADTDQIRKNLDRYMRDEYLADSTVKIDHPKAGDFSKPFRLRLEVSNAARGNVSQVDGAVAIPLGGMLDNLPGYFKEAEKKPTADDAAKPAKKRTEDFLLNEAFVEEWHYRIALPPGYQVKKMPDPPNIQMGPARLSGEFHTEGNTVTADFRFDSVKRRYTADEGAELKKAVAEFYKQPVMLVRLEPIGQAYLSSGKVREAIEQFTSMAKQYPTKPVYRVQLSEALLVAGCGLKAREEARLAVTIDPNSGLAFQNLGYVLLHDMIGRSFEKGFDPAGSEAALRKAVELDPKDMLSRHNLAVVLEHSVDARRYKSPQRLNEAIKVLRDMGDELAANGLTDNLLYDLAYAGRFQELKTEVEKLGSSSLHLSFKLVAATKLENAAAAIAEAEKETSDEVSRSSALQTAGNILLEMRDYPNAADLLAAGAKGTQDASQLVGRANAFRKVTRFDDLTIRTDTPGNTVRSLMAALYFRNVSVKTVERLMAKEAMVGQNPDRLAEEFATGSGVGGKAMAAKAGVSPEVLFDLIVSLIQPNIEQNGDDGYLARIAVPGGPAQSFYLVREQGEFRLLGAKQGAEGVGRRVLGDVERGNIPIARSWLDWLRDDIKAVGGDDPLEGPMFPHFWTKGWQADANAIRYAAAMLIGDSTDGKDSIPILREALLAAKDEPAKSFAQVAYVIACNHARQWEDALVVAKPLAEAHPESPRAARLLADVYHGLKQWNLVDGLAASRLARDSGDTEASRIAAYSKYGQEKFAECEALFRRIAESPTGSALDWNMVGWTAILAGDVAPEKIDLVQRAASANQSMPNLLHTLAAMYAEVGKNAEARETILAAMRAWSLDEPNEESWYVFGRLAEAFGVRDDAIADYSKLHAPKDDNPGSTFNIAAKRLAKLR